MTLDIDIISEYIMVFFTLYLPTTSAVIGLFIFLWWYLPKNEYNRKIRKENGIPLEKRAKQWGTLGAICCFIAISPFLFIFLAVMMGYFPAQR